MVGDARTIGQFNTTRVLFSKWSSRSIDQQPFSSRPFHSLAPTLAKPSEAQDSAPFNFDGLRLRRGGLNSIHSQLEELDPARRPASAPARRPAPSRAAVRPLAPLCRGALPCRASQRALGWPVRLSLLLPPRSRPLPAPRGQSMLAPSPPARTPPAPRRGTALFALLCASSLSSFPFSRPRVREGKRKKSSSLGPLTLAGWLTPPQRLCGRACVRACLRATPCSRRPTSTDVRPQSARGHRTQRGA